MEWSKPDLTAIKPTIPPISEELKTPCYSDLMPEAPTSDNESDLVKLITDNNLKTQECYNRQLDLILEVINRGYE